MLRGREFTRADDLHADRVAVVSESFERRYYQGHSALGMMIVDVTGSQPRSVRIIGVARDARYDRMASTSVDLRNPATEIAYLPILQLARLIPSVTMIVRSAVAPSTTTEAFRRVVERHAGMRVVRVTNVGAYLDDAASRERFSAALGTAFGVLAVLLATVGVLGVLAFQVTRRTKEIGVRMALGAQRRDTVFLVMRQTLGMLGVALAVGLPCAAAAAWLVRSQLYGVAPWDPRALLAATVITLAAGLAASAIPSYRAASVDPLVALREE
jgi:ABC-type antimicrobial peptide transport system permease subunit